MEDKELRRIVDELLTVLHEQAKDLEMLVAHVEQVTQRLPKDHQFGVVVSELSALHHRVKKLTASAGPESAKAQRGTKK